MRADDGSPVEGVLVMGADLNYAETDAEGRFRLDRPELALFFWGSGFLAAARALKAGQDHIDVVLRRAVVLRARA
ncbi:MAG TPA: hypothetical protein VMG40_04520 [Bryobacteraceae bacterium]|nr:hypothetical protein [Bryobacteraceae bacterium]